MRPPFMSAVFIIALCVSAVLSIGELWPPPALGEESVDVRLSFGPVVKQAAPAVVNIYTRKVIRTSRTLSPFLDDPVLRHFFSEQLGRSSERIQRSLGSGVIIRSDGIVVTNHHVVKDSDAVTVVLSDRREYEASMIGSDERTDIAVLKILSQKEKFPTLAMGDSDTLDVGDLVLAIGNPFGVGQTVTSGIVSAVARTLAGMTDYRFFIQTDAAINPGNSGGALVTLDGRLAGINTAIYSQNGSNLGIGFAVPANMVQVVVKTILAHGRTIRPWVGIDGDGLTQEIADLLGLQTPSGVLVTSVHHGSPGEAAGLRPGDVVLSVNDHRVADVDTLRYRLTTLPLGSTATLKLLHAGSIRTVNLQLLAPPEIPPREVTEIKGNNPFSGATVANLNPTLAEELGLAFSESAVVVIHVRQQTPAEGINLRSGDVVLEVDGHRIQTVRDLTRLLTLVSSEGWRIALRRGENVLHVMVREN